MLQLVSSNVLGSVSLCNQVVRHSDDVICSRYVRKFHASRLTLCWIQVSAHFYSRSHFYLQDFDNCSYKDLTGINKYQNSFLINFAETVALHFRYYCISRCDTKQIDFLFGRSEGQIRFVVLSGRNIHQGNSICHAHLFMSRNIKLSIDDAQLIVLRRLEPLNKSR